MDKKALINILTEPKNALVKQYRKLFSMEGIQLTFEKDAIEEVAALALERNTGARGLRSILENVMMDAMYEVPSRQDVSECVVTREAVRNPQKLKLLSEKATPILKAN